ncbi:hypothetical protein RHMOL_Rhmol06G0110300 [Rhododendron molle]|uniref:Uncharacterized protein n=1 Tax=Rhododendron molle TaxID=49168 RepID=A0ACC0ND29_RHOML|nr:hypothetical protein RHMOL_Rhmol06G0110300 [Rhododendron molle]
MATPSSDIVGLSSHPPCRCEYPSSDEETIEEPGLFDIATYVLPSRRLAFGGFLQYRPPVGGPEAEIVRREPEQHLSVLNVMRNRRLEAHGGGKEVHKWFLVLPEQTRELVRAAGFEAFVLGHNLPKIDWSLMTSLVERWWDTTNTFHLPSASKMTITPGHIDLAWLSKTFMKTDILTQVSVEQLTRAFLVYLLGQTLFANKDGSVHTQFLAPLQHLGAIREFAALRKIAKPNIELVLVNLAFQLWAFEHLLQFPPETRHGDVNYIPRYERWLVGQRKPRSPVLSLPEWQRVLDRLTVWFDPWGGVPKDAPLARSRVLDRTRSLLEGPFCRAWYLGDRVASQWHPHAEALQFVPPPPPASMRSTSSMSKADLKDAWIRDWAGLLLQTGDYMEYYRLFLAPAVAAPSIALVWPRAPSFVSFHSDDGEEERLTLTPCTTQLYTLPAGVSQLEAERVPAAGGEGMGTSEQSPSSSQRPSRRRRHD